MPFGKFLVINHEEGCPCSLFRNPCDKHSGGCICHISYTFFFLSIPHYNSGIYLEMELKSCLMCVLVTQQEWKVLLPADPSLKLMTQLDCLLLYGSWWMYMSIYCTGIYITTIIYCTTCNMKQQFTFKFFIAVLWVLSLLPNMKQLTFVYN